MNRLSHRLRDIQKRAREDRQVLRRHYAQPRAETFPEPVSDAVEVTVDEQGDERRQAQRRAMRSEVTIRRIGGFNFQVALNDISAQGCNVELIEAGEVGDAVITRLPRLEPLGSLIRWTDGCRAGVEFGSAIHPAVLDLVIDRLEGRE